MIFYSFFFFNGPATTEIKPRTHSFPTRRSSDLQETIDEVFQGGPAAVAVGRRPVRPAAGPARFRPRPRRARADAGHAADGAGDGRFAFRRLRAAHRTR